VNVTEKLMTGLISFWACKLSTVESSKWCFWQMGSRFPFHQ